MLCSHDIVVVAIVTLKLWTAWAHTSQQQNASTSKTRLQLKTLNAINMRSERQISLWGQENIEVARRYLNFLARSCQGLVK